MKNNILIEIEVSLTKMEGTGKIDPAILNSLSKLGGLLSGIRSRWLEVEDSDGFYFYQAARNAELILGRMESRFRDSQKADYDPKTAEDSLALLPAMDGILEIAQSYTVRKHSINEVLDRTRDLRNQAASTNLIEPPEANRKYIDKDNMRLRLAALMKGLDAAC